MPIEPEAMKSAIEANCDTVEKMVTRACAVNVIFTYQRSNPEEETEGMTAIQIVAAGDRGTLVKAR